MLPDDEGNQLITTTFTPLSLRTKAEHAYHEIRVRILDGELAPGAIVTSEFLAAELGLSATPVREALRRLAADDLVVLSAHRDLRIKPLSKAEIEGLYAVRRNLDMMAASLACVHAGDEDLEVPGVLLPQQSAAEDVRRAIRDNREFHRAIYARCANDVLIGLLESLWDRTDRYRLLLLHRQDRAEGIHREHVAIAEAFAARDGDVLRHALEHHTDAALDLLVARLDA